MTLRCVLIYVQQHSTVAFSSMPQVEQAETQKVYILLYSEYK